MKTLAADTGNRANATIRFLFFNIDMLIFLSFMYSHLVAPAPARQPSAHLINNAHATRTQKRPRTPDSNRLGLSRLRTLTRHG